MARRQTPNRFVGNGAVVRAVDAVAMALQKFTVLDASLPCASSTSWRLQMLHARCVRH